MTAVFPVVGSVVGTTVKTIVPSSLPSLSQIFGDSDDGFAFDFTRTSNDAETTMYQDSSFTTPVTSNGDVVGGVRDESGNDNDFIQGTAANKPTWTEDEGIKAVDSGDLLTATFGATLQDFTVVTWIVTGKQA